MISILIYKKTEKRRIRKKIRLLEDEKIAIEETIKKIQRKRFQSGEMSRGDYRIAIDKYQKRLIKIKKDILTYKQKQ